MKITPDSVSVVKKTVKLGAPTGVTATQDSTAYFGELANKRLENLDKYEKNFFNTYKGATMSDLLKEDGYKNILKGVETAALSRMRQANKGKEGYDKNGYPVAKVGEKQAKAIAVKITGNK